MNALQIMPPRTRSTIFVQPPQIASGVLPSFCVSGTVSNGKACVNTPIGDECVSIPSFVPSGTAFSACADLCKTFGIPTGVCITVKALGKQVARECFGKC